MIITSSSIGMDSARTYASVNKDVFRSENTMYAPFLETASKASSEEIKDDEKEARQNASSNSNLKQTFDDIYGRMKTYVANSTYEDKFEQDAMNRIRTQCIQYLLYLLFGCKLSDDELNILQPDTNNSTSSEENVSYVTTTSSFQSFFAEQEETSYKTTGTVQTADGRTISFNLDLSMSRSFASFYEKTVSKTVAFTDPLVINLDAPCAEVSDVKIQFDLDADGELDSISMLSSSSGYLALDKNEDGIIGDGSELFGTTSGDGFKDLSEYDLDKNGFIDEADPIWNKLKICVFDENGNQTLYKLSDKGVGAICLQSSQTDFSLNNLHNNETNARIRQTGIFLYENGNVGTIQHLDLAQ